MSELISGGKGGGKGGGSASPARTPVEYADTGRSRQLARVVDAICEGEIHGLVDGLKSVYLDNVPLMSADGSYNFQSVVVDWRYGTQAQTYLPGFSATENEVPVNLELTYNVAQTIAITDTNVDAVRCTVGTPRQTASNPTTGDLTGSAGVYMRIEVNNNGGGWVTMAYPSLGGKITSRYQRSYGVQLPRPGPWQVRIIRDTPDSTSASYVDNTFWDSYTEVIHAKLAYPNTAVVGLQIDASQFNSIPARAYEMKGLKVRVPVNYDPATRVYTGQWDGTFKTAWTDNAAWCYYDMITTDRYGLGEYLTDDQIDKWALYTIGQYSDGWVMNGTGGWEPRFTCNLYLQTQDEAFNVIQHMASIFRAMVYWSGGLVTAIQDSPVDPIALITAANVVEGVFNYEGSSRRARHTVAKVAWNDPNDEYKQRIEYVEDPIGIARYGVNATDVVAVGCTSRGQAHRVGTWMLYTERAETEIVGFKMGLDAVPLYPGAVIQIADPHRAGARFGGRIISATANGVVLDSSVLLTGGQTYTFCVALPDNSIGTYTVVYGQPVTTSTLTLTPAFTTAPAPGAVWTLSSPSLAPTLWRVMSISEEEGGSLFSISAVAHDPNKYLAVEQGIILESPPSSVLSSKTQVAPTEVRLSDVIYTASDGTINTRLSVTWDTVPGAVKYIVEAKRANMNWEVITKEARSTLVELDAYDKAFYEVRVTAVSVLGVLSLPTLSNPYEVVGKAAPPPDVSSFYIATQSDGTRSFSWALTNPPLDMAGFQIRSYLGVTSNWDAMSPMHNGLLIASPWETNQLPAGTYTLAIKAVDTTGNLSTNAKFITGTLGNPRLSGSIGVYSAKGDGWPGTKTSCHIDLPINYLIANETNATPWVRTWADNSWIETPAGTISYEQKFDVGVVTDFTPLVTATATGTQTITETHSNDDISYSVAAAVGLKIKCRYVKIKVSVTGAAPVIEEVATILSATPVIETFTDLDTSLLTGNYRIAAGHIRLPRTKTFSVCNNVSVALQNVAAGWSWVLINKTLTYGPEIKIYNAANVLADAVIDAEMKGV